MEDVKGDKEAGNVIGMRGRCRQVDPTRGGGKPLLEEVEGARGCALEAGG